MAVFRVMSPDDGNSKLIWNVGLYLRDNMTQHPWRQLFLTRRCQNVKSHCYVHIITTIKYLHLFVSGGPHEFSDNYNISNCVKPPCRLKKKTNADLVLKFTPGNKTLLSVKRVDYSLPEAHPASYTMGTGVLFPGGKAQPGRGAHYSPPSRAEVKNE
jgi:hypothetical protein